MARNTTTLDQVISDFVLTSEGDDYIANASDVAMRSIALRGIREMGFDLSNEVRSLKLNITSSNNTVELPDDFVDIIKIGVIGDDGMVYVFSENKNINYSQSYADSTGAAVGVSSSANDANSDGVFDRVDSKGATTGSSVSSDSLSSAFDSYIFRNFVHGTSNGRLYGVGGGHKSGSYRMNLDQNRIELDTTSVYDQVVIEYIADQARSTNPTVHLYLEEALRCYMYYKLVERKSTVPQGEKARARSEYYNERRKANARMKSFSKEDALQVIRQNFKQSPKV